MKALGQSVRAGDTLPYVICEGTDSSPANRAYHPDEVNKSNGELKLDVLYYVKQQIHPVVGRLCEPIEGTDNAQLAEHLGLDTSQYYREKSTGTEEDFAEGLTVMQSDGEKFKDVDNFVVSCTKCKHEFELSSIVRGDVADLANDLQCGLDCPNCGERMPAKRVCNLITIRTRSYVSKYYL